MFQGPKLYLFSDLYFSYQPSVEQSHIINYPKKNSIDPQKAAYLALSL